MTRDDIILLAREALKHDPGYAVWTLSTPHLEMIVSNVIKAEREACAKVCEKAVEYNPDDADVAYAFADAIRARDNT